MKETIVKIGFGVMGIIMLTGCQPRVLTDILMTYPEKSVENVVVYEPEDSIPADAMTLGYVAVIDRGTTTHCNYDYVKSLAIKESAKVGGNGFQIVQHQTPSLWKGSCHQIAGNILLAGKIDPDSLVFVTENDFVSQLEAMQEAEERFYQKQILSRPPINRLRANFGLGWDPDKIETYDNLYRPKLGSSLLAGYECLILGNNTYMGFTYMHHNATCSKLGNYRMDYIGATASWSEVFGNKRNWLYDISFGVGYNRYTIKNFHKQSGLGFHFTADVDYMITRHFGIGIEAGYVVGTFKRPDEVIVKEEDDVYARGALLLTGGLRWYF